MNTDQAKRYRLVVRIQYGVKHIEYKKEWFEPKVQEDIEQSDSLQEIISLIEEYKELYGDDPKPVHVDGHYVNKYTGKEKIRLNLNDWWAKVDNPVDWKWVDEFVDYSDNKKWWGYLVADYVDERVIITGGDKGIFENLVSDFPKVLITRTTMLPKLKKNLKSSLKVRDIFFRKPGEIPEGYVWDGDEEYQGWLQYRWGDGKNSISYIKPPKKENSTKETEEASEEDLAKYVSNHEFRHNNDGEEVKFTDEMIKYLETTQKFEDIFLKKDIKDFRDKQVW